jgi:hypothetical protein
MYWRILSRTLLCRRPADVRRHRASANHRKRSLLLAFFNLIYVMLVCSLIYDWLKIIQTNRTLLQPLKTNMSQFNPPAILIKYYFKFNFNFSFHTLCCLISVTISIQSNTTNYHVRLSNSEIIIRSMPQHVSVVCRPSSGLQESPYVSCNTTILKYMAMGSQSV